MPKDKIDFIADLLADKRIELSLKEKAFELASKEIKKVLSIENKNSKRIEEIERRLNEENKIPVTQIFSSIPEVENKLTIHKPKDVAEFMSLFNSPNGLKYLTHDFDESTPFEIEVFLKNTETIFKNITSKFSNPHLSIPTSLWSIINQFAFSESPEWGTNKSIKEGWSKSKWIKWSKENKKHLKRNPQFEKIIEQFRSYTRVESPKLKIILEGVLKEKFGNQYNNLDISIIDCEKADFYTHVEDFKYAIGLILDGIRKRLETSNKISIQYIRKTNGDYYERIIKICHHNSLPDRPLDEFVAEISKEQKGELGDVTRKLRGYCNWSVETIWDKTPVRINILHEEKDVNYDFLTEESMIKGFTHILTFYYK